MRRVRSASTIIEEAANAFNVPPAMMRTKRQKNSVCLARFAAMKVIRDERGYSLPRIARCLGLDHHTSVLHGLRRFDELFATDAGFADAFRRMNQ